MKINKEMGEMTRTETAEYLGIAFNTLKKLNIPHFRVGRFEVYRKSDIEEWKNKQVAEYKQGNKQNED